MLSEKVDAIGVGVGKVGAYGGGGGAVLSAMTLHDWGIVAGIVIGVVGYVTQVVFNRRRDRRERESREEARAEHLARMRSYGGSD